MLKILNYPNVLVRTIRCEEMNSTQLAMLIKQQFLCDHQASENREFLKNTDGTTKCPKKLRGIAINTMVISVNELPDGTVASAIGDVSRTLEKLRRVAHALSLPNSDSINRTLIAASQKKFNKLIEENREKEEARFGPATLETVGLIESFCSMHLGINFWKAFLSVIFDDDDSGTRYHPVDVLVHEFLKVFGKHGTPEYRCGVNHFPDLDFLVLMTEDSSLSEDTREYYRSCTNAAKLAINTLFPLLMLPRSYFLEKQQCNS